MPIRLAVVAVADDKLFAGPYAYSNASSTIHLTVINIIRKRGKRGPFVWHRGGCGLL
jgi:hypothetical protein